MRLVHEHVEPRRDAARDELVDERILVDDGATGRVDERCAVTQEREPFARDQPRVSAVSGVCSETMSDSRSRSSSSR